MREVVRFRAHVGDQQVPCAISFEALQDQRHFHEDPDPPLDTFRRHRSVSEPDGAILIRAQDW
jgi:hypothetical protein